MVSEEGSGDEASQESSASSYQSSPHRKIPQNEITKEDKQLPVAYCKSEKTKMLNFASTQKSFRFVAPLSHL